MDRREATHETVSLIGRGIYMSLFEKAMQWGTQFHKNEIPLALERK